MKINIKYNYNQDFETCDVDNIPDIPNYNQITRIDCSYNQLSYLPDLPSTLTFLHCSNNQLSSLPDLPSTLTHLWCYNNKLSSLPDLPSTIKVLHCSGNQFIKKDKDRYQESIIRDILKIIPWTNQKECFLNNLIKGYEIKCSKCQKMIVLKEQYIFKSNCVVQTMICIGCS